MHDHSELLLLMSNIAVGREQRSLCRGLEELEVDVSESVRARPQVREVYPSDCGFRFFAYSASNGRTLYEPARNFDAGHRHRCPICARRDASRTAVKMYHRLFAFSWKHLWAITLTTPKEFVGEVGCEKFRKDRFSDLLGMAREYMETVHPKVPYIVHFHHWASSKPLSKPHYHVHITAIACEYDFPSEPKGALIEKHLNPQLSKYRLEEVKRIWARIVGYDEYDKLDLEYRSFSRKTRFWKGSNDELETLGGSGRIMHWLKYVYRYYIQDVDSYFSRYENEYWDDESLYWLRWHQFEKNVNKVRKKKLVEDGVESVVEEEYVSVKQQWSRRSRGYCQLSNTKISDFVDMYSVRDRVKHHFSYSHEKYDPVTKEIVIGKPTEVMIDGSIFERDMIVRARVEYVDYPRKMEDWVVFLPPPKECMRWSYYPVKKKKRKASVKDG